MPGVNSDYLAYPILDLISDMVRKAVRDHRHGGDDDGTPLVIDLDEIPSVQLIREHPKDASKTVVSGALLTYNKAQYTSNILMLYGDTVNPFKLTGVTIDLNDSFGIRVIKYTLTLVYDTKGLMTAVQVASE